MSHHPAKFQTRRTTSMRAELMVTLKRASKLLGRPIAAIVDEAVTAWLAAQGIPVMPREAAVDELKRTKKRRVRFDPPPFAKLPSSRRPRRHAACDTSWTEDAPFGGVREL